MDTRTIVKQLSTQGSAVVRGFAATVQSGVQDLVSAGKEVRGGSDGYKIGDIGRGLASKLVSLG